MKSLPPPLVMLDDTHVGQAGRSFLYFGGCDYFRLARDPRIAKAVCEAVQKHGTTPAASRLTTGNHPLLAELEENLAQWLEAPGESVLTTASGYSTNLILAQTLRESVDVALIDEQAHASLRDAADLLHAEIRTFQHRSAEELRKKLATIPESSNVLILSDGLFAHDGSVAPVAGYLEALPANGLLLIDDAHGLGTLGDSGRGTLEHARIKDDRIILTATFSKALGASGGLIVAPPPMREQIIERSRAFGGSTPLPLPLAAAVVQALQILAKEPGLRDRLRRNIRHAADSLAGTSMKGIDSPGPVFSVVPPTREQADALENALLHAGILPCRIVYPGGPQGGYFRFALSSRHSLEEVDRLTGVLNRHTGGR